MLSTIIKTSQFIDRCKKNGDLLLEILFLKINFLSLTLTMQEKRIAALSGIPFEEWLTYKKEELIKEKLRLQGYSIKDIVTNDWLIKL